MKDYYVQKENWSYPEMKEENKYCWMVDRWVDKVNEWINVSTVAQLPLRQ